MTTGAARSHVSRHDVVNRLLGLYDAPRYLEVGVCTGATFDRVAAPTKVAVDPDFRFDHTAPERVRPGTSYHQVTSDEYFGSVVEPGQQFDVVFLDGLHTVEQTLRDLTNTLDHLQPRGVVVIDDVRPPSYLASLPQRGKVRRARRRLDDPEKAWTGDVYRLVFFVDTFFQSLSFRTISDNHGQAVVWRRRREEVTSRTLAEVGLLPYEVLLLEEEVLRLAPFAEILDEVRADLG